jgi:hypothetical protein
LAALVMNMVSGLVGQYTVVTADDRTAGDVLAYVSYLVMDDNPDNDKLAKKLARRINLRRIIAAGIIPEGNILYKGKGQPNLDIDFGFGVPDAYELAQNYPNPFNPTTTIKYSITKQSHVSLKVYNILGHEVNTLVNNQQSAGSYTFKFDGSNLSSGVYFYQIHTQEFVETKRMLLVK